MNKFGFWLLPPKEVQAEYKKVIDKYSGRLKTPSFEPHITILGTVKGDREEIIGKVEKIALNISPIEIMISDITISTTYHQCVFARIKPTPSLLDAHLDLKDVLDSTTKGMYVPHMSLIYGDISLKEKNEIAEEIQLTTSNFQADRLCVVNTDDLDPKTWTHVAEFELRS